MKIGILVGSLRKHSITQKIANNIKTLFPGQYEVELINITNLPFYNQDFDDYDNVPKVYVTFREKIKSMDGFVFVTAEYNRSVPAILTNALDVASRPKVNNAWDNKPAGVISQSPGNLGGFGANHHLRQILTGVNMPIVQHPEVYLSHSAELFDENGTITNEGTLKFLQGFIDALVYLIESK